jgi:hypothetical protein
MFTTEEIAEAAYEIVSRSVGKRKIRPRDLFIAVKKQYEGQVTKDQFKEALIQIIYEGRCVYSYYMGNYVEIPHDEGSMNE